MFRHTLLIISPILICFFVLDQTQANECIDVPNTPYRTFKSLVDYQGNKIMFDPSEKDSKGNRVSFMDGEINPISKNSFLTKDSQHIRQLNLANHQIQLIEDGAFLSLNCVSALDLRKNKIETITKDVFQGLYHLHQLDLSENKIVEIPERVFRFTAILTKLNMSRNNLKVLHADSFYKLLYLEELDISYNYLHKINSETFRFFDNLLNLQIGSNQIQYLELEEFKNLTSLKTLNLSNNELKSIDFLYNFSFGANLTEFYIDDNYLTQFNVRGFRKHLPSVKVIDISENLWLCADLVEILRVFNDSRISYKGSETSLPNFGGIACNRSIEEYQNKKWTEPVDVITTTTTVQPITTENPRKTETELSTSVEILNSIKNLQSIVICLVVVIVVFIFIQFSIKTKCMRYLRGRRDNSSILNDSNVEDISLLRGRF